LTIDVASFSYIMRYFDLLELQSRTEVNKNVKQYWVCIYCIWCDW